MRNPTRRNRNIGTKKSGYSQDNSLVIPERADDYKVYWERLNDPAICPITIGDNKITILIEPTRQGFVHACTPNDIIKVIELIPEENLENVEIIILRQPKKKEEIISPVWGRFIYYADLGRYTGSAIIIEAQPINNVMKWDSKLTPFYQKELDSLRSHGHAVKQVKRGWEIHTTPETVRHTQLYRTLPHEYGHAEDYIKNYIDPAIEAKTEEEDEYISKVFDSKPWLDKEEYANRYAREFYDKNLKAGHLPFDRIVDKEFFKKYGINEEWFSENTYER